MFRRFLLIILITLPQYLSAGNSASHTVTIEVKKPTTVAIPAQESSKPATTSQIGAVVVITNQ